MLDVSVVAREVRSYTFLCASRVKSPVRMFRVAAPSLRIFFAIRVSRITGSHYGHLDDWIFSSYRTSHDREVLRGKIQMFSLKQNSFSLKESHRQHLHVLL